MQRLVMPFVLVQQQIRGSTHSLANAAMRQQRSCKSRS